VVTITDTFVEMEGIAIYLFIHFSDTADVDPVPDGYTEVLPVMRYWI
jgi:hypothetical protein